MVQNKKIDRRRFIEKSGRIATAGVLFNVLPARSSKQSFEGEIKIAVIGCGGRGSGAAHQAILADPDVRIVALADVFKDQAQACYDNLLNRYGNSGKLRVDEETILVGFDAYKEAIDMADVVILATPPGFRPIHFEYAVEKNKQVFMEKPLATDVVGIKKILEVGKKAELKKLNVIVGLQRHYQRNYLQVKEMLDRNKIGRIISGQVYWNSGGVWVRPRKTGQTELEYQMRNWYYFNWICGDHIVEQHIHNIDVANWFIGDIPISAQGMGGREIRKGPDHGHIFDHHFVEFTYPNGQIVASQCRHQRGCMNRVDEVFQGTKGSVHVNSGNYGLISSNKGKELYNHKGENDINPYQQEHNLLFSAIRRGDYKYNDVEMGANSTMTSILGRMATYSGQVITWDEAMASNLDLVPELHSFNDPAPVLPDAEGNYPIPIPGKTAFI